MTMWRLLSDTGTMEWLIDVENLGTDDICRKIVEWVGDVLVNDDREWYLSQDEYGLKLRFWRWRLRLRWGRQKIAEWLCDRRRHRMMLMKIVESYSEWWYGEWYWLMVIEWLGLIRDAEEIMRWQRVIEWNRSENKVEKCSIWKSIKEHVTRYMKLST